MTDETTPQDSAAMSPASAGSVANDQAEVLAKGIADIIRIASEPDWVPVTERLPKEYETVLVATDGSVSAGEIRFPDDEDGLSEPWWMVFKDKRDSSPSWAGMVSLNDVTHWMPLPAPPTDDK